MMGARPIRAANRSASAHPGQTASPVPATAASRTIPPNFWTDYVQVDAIDGNTLRIHSTRHPDVTPPYDIVTDESTILQPAEGIFGPSPGIGPGTRLYFTGLVESGLDLLGG